MKKFSFMMAFFTAIIVFHIFHQVEKPTHGTESEWHAYHNENDASITKSLFMAAISSIVVYFGVSGFLAYWKKNEKQE